MARIPSADSAFGVVWHDIIRSTVVSVLGTVFNYIRTIVSLLKVSMFLYV